FNCPAEVAEARYGLGIEQVALNSEPGGEGQWRGGKGIEVHYRVRADDNFLSVGYTRSRMPPWGASGGLDGSVNYVEVMRRDGSRDRHAFTTNLTVNEGDIIRVVTGNGGGYGDPKLRSRADIERDLKNEYLTPERAKEIYGYDA
ncbi:hydantoinase B/oxoprolinase family protein, partial [Martelella sp. AD-3]